MERVMKKERLTAEDCEKLFESGVIKRVDDEILDALIAGEGNIIACSWNAMMYALCELKVCRKAEKEQGHTDHSASEKDSAGATQEKAVLPIPCTKGFEDWTVKDYFQKINEELDEMKEEIYMGQVKSFRKSRIAEEAADTITAITSMLEAMCIDERQRQAAQRRVNEHNRQRGRC